MDMNNKQRDLRTRKDQHTNFRIWRVQWVSQQKVISESSAIEPNLLRLLGHLAVADKVRQGHDFAEEFGGQETTFQSEDAWYGTESDSSSDSSEDPLWTQSPSEFVDGPDRSNPVGNATEGVVWFVKNDFEGILNQVKSCSITVECHEVDADSGKITLYPPNCKQHSVPFETEVHGDGAKISTCGDTLVYHL